MTGKTALLLGATGATGKHILQELLKSSEYTKVAEYGRRVTDAQAVAGTGGSDKLVQKAIDFEKLGEAGLRDEKWDVVFIALGTTRKLAGSAEMFEKIDREYVVNAACEAKAETGDQRLVYLSSAGADASSMLLYSRSKGLTEQALASLGYSDTIVFRPGFLAEAQRPESQTIVSVLTSRYRRLMEYVSTETSELAKSIVRAGTLGSAALPKSANAKTEGKEGATFTVIDNAGSLNLAKPAA
ncbi:hypothetical protein H0H81_012176 [Sphagnurus paluster]|uniref:NAD(P)-binding domain-containing protein n=1 Tax=Sphagnurus paluster TaxID=117069 RepID=A0A9P7FQJ3_9AGAR|nr:hypothetical protein H0H81_012176 [Sphagnurus paluster]